MKTNETKQIEEILWQSCFAPNNPSLMKEYGCEEVTIGFQRDHRGHERVDFLSYDARNDIFRCYEIKVSMNDFNSHAKLSWYGHYNYLVLSKDLYAEEPLEWWKERVLKEVGIIVADTKNMEKRAVKKALRVDISKEEKDMLKDSLIRSLAMRRIKR